VQINGKQKKGTSDALNKGQKKFHVDAILRWSDENYSICTNGVPLFKISKKNILFLQNKI
jgi:hypothetical protein